MPRTLFDQTLAPRGRNARPLGTISLSILLHAAALAVLVALQLTSSIHGLEVVSPLTAYVAPPVPAPVPPPARPPSVSHTPTVSAAPAADPDPLTVEPPLTSTSTPGAPPSLSIGPPGDVGQLFPPGTGVTPLAAPPAPPAQGPARVGGEILAPTRLVYVPPVYPSMARLARVDGEVVLEATIDQTGVVRDVKVLHSIPLLDRAAVDAVTGWRYSPTRLNGQAVPVVMVVRVRFSLT